MRLRDEGLTWRELDGQTVILDLTHSKYLKTNATGTVLLKRLSSDCSRDDLVAALVDEFGVGTEQAGADTDAFLDMLRQKDLLAGE